MGARAIIMHIMNAKIKEWLRTKYCVHCGGSGSFNSMDSNSVNSLKIGQNFGQKFFNVLVKQCDFLQQLKFWLPLMVIGHWPLGQILNYQTSNLPILQKPNGYLRIYCSCTCVVRICIGQCIFGYFSTLFEDLLQKSFLI